MCVVCGCLCVGVWVRMSSVCVCVCVRGCVYGVYVCGVCVRGGVCWCVCLFVCLFISVNNQKYSKYKILKYTMLAAG